MKAAVRGEKTSEPHRPRDRQRQQTDEQRESSAKPLERDKKRSRLFELPFTLESKQRAKGVKW